MTATFLIDMIHVGAGAVGQADSCCGYTWAGGNIEEAPTFEPM